jgi:hypothetical protein
MDLNRHVKKQSRIRQQEKRRVSPKIGTLSRQLQHLALVEKRKKSKVKVRVEIKKK